MIEDHVLKKGPFKGCKVQPAPTQLVEQYSEAVDKVVAAIDEAMDTQVLLVTDMSSLRDFGPDRVQLATISSILGIPVSEQDLICDIAMRLSPKN